MTTKQSNWSPARIIDVNKLLKDSETLSLQNLLDAGFSKREINTCVNQRPIGLYAAYVENKHPLLHDYSLRYDLAIIQHARYLKRRLGTLEESARQLVSDGYALAWMHHHSGAADRFIETVSIEQSRRSADKPKKRKRKPYTDRLILEFLEEYREVGERDIRKLHRFLKMRNSFLNGLVKVDCMKDTKKKWVYHISGVHDRNIIESITRDRLRGKLEKASSQHAE
jgi:hypothetical protein